MLKGDTLKISVLKGVFISRTSIYMRFFSHAFGLGPREARKRQQGNRNSQQSREQPAKQGTAEALYKNLYCTQKRTGKSRFRANKALISGSRY